MRAVAAEAHVTTGLVHHYFESKDELIIATTRSIASDVSHAARRVYETTHDPGAMVAAVWRFFELRPAFRSIVLWWALDQRDVTQLMGDHPFLEMLASILGAHRDPAAAASAGVVAMLILVGHLSPGMNAAVGLPPADPAATRELERLSVELVRAGVSRA